MSMNGKAIRRTLTPKLTFPVTTFPIAFPESHNAGLTTNSKLGFDTKTLLDTKESSESQISSYLNKIKSLAPKQLLESLDAETAALLNTTCCSTEQTTQFWHYLIGKACRSESACTTIDVPESGIWGGWDHSKFLTLYIRALLETMARIKRGEDLSINEELLAILEKELAIAQDCYRSALDINTIATAYREIDSKQQAYDVALNERNQQYYRVQDLIARHHQASTNLAEAGAENATFSKRYDLLITEYNALKSQLEQFEAHVKQNNFALSQPRHDKYLASCKRLDDLQSQINKIVADFNSNLLRQQNLTSEIVELNSNIPVTNSTLHNKEDSLAEAQRILQQALHQLQVKQTRAKNNLIEIVQGLKKGETYCHAAGFLGHAIYINFTNLKDRFEIKICNDGLASNNHPHLKTNPTLVLPVIINFPKNAKGKKELDAFCHNIIDALIEPEKKAVKLIYDHGYGRKLTEEQTNERLPMISAEIPQETGNCTAKGYLHALRERLGNKILYRHLLFSLFVWSKKADFYRKHLAKPQKNNLPQNAEALITTEDLKLLSAAESAFSDVHSTQFRSHFNMAFVAGVMFAAPAEKQPVALPYFATAAFPTTLMSRTSDDNVPTPYEPSRIESQPAPVLYSFPGGRRQNSYAQYASFADFQPLDSRVNAPEFSEDDLERLLRSNTRSFDRNG